MSPVAEEYDERQQKQVAIWETEIAYMETFSPPLSKERIEQNAQMWHLHI